MQFRSPVRAGPRRDRSPGALAAALVALALVLSAVAAPSAAWAYLDAPATGTGSATLATLQPPTGLAVPALSTGTVHLAWVAPTGAGTVAPTGYSIARTRTSDGSSTDACGTNAATPTTALTCDDLLVPVGVFAYTVTAVFHSWTAVSVLSSTVTVSLPAAGLAFQTQPGNGSTTTALQTQPVVAVQDATGAVVTGSVAAVALTLTTPAGGILSCTTSTSRTSVAGIASFAGCKVTTPGSYTLTATSAGLASARSIAFTVLGPVNKLVFTALPSSSTGGIPFATQPVVTLQDSAGQTVTTSASTVALKITGVPAGVVLACTPSVSKAASAGIASFAGCKIDKPGTYTLTATAGAVTVASGSLTIAVGPASKLAFSTVPSGATAGTVFSVQPVITVLDAGGNAVSASTASVTLSAPVASGLKCAALTVAAVSGVANFTGCQINKSGATTLTATSAGLPTPTITTSVSVAVGAPAKLAFTTQPSTSAVAGTAFAAQPRVLIQDAVGNTVTTSTVDVTLSLTAAGGATLGCSANPKAAVAGLATFAGCAIEKIGSYTLTAVSGALTNAVSTTVTINPGVATSLQFTASPMAATVNTAFPIQPQITLRDALGNRTTSTALVTLTLTAPAGATLSCTANPRAGVAGVAAFAGCKVNMAGTYTLTATSGTIAAATSGPFPVN